MCADPIRPRTRILVVAMLFLAAAALAIPISEHHPWLLYNASGSAPIGFYRIENRSPERGETAVVRPLRPSKICSPPIACCPPACLFSSALLRVAATVFAGRRGLFSSTEKPSPRRLITMPKAVPCRHGMGVSPSFPASFSSCNHIPIRSTAGISGRSASAKSSASRTLCGRGIQANETRDSASATTRSEE